MVDIGSIYQLIEKIKISRVYFNNNEYNNNELKLISLLKKKNIPFQKISEKSFQINNFKINAISYNLNNENDSSLMLMIKNKLSFLLMGDASTKSEELLVSDYNLSSINVLKLGHHGSITSTGERLLNKIKPNISLISVGENNLYHHPSTIVLERIKNTKIYQTSIDGSVKINLDDYVTISTNAP